MHYRIKKGLSVPFLNPIHPYLRLLGFPVEKGTLCIPVLTRDAGKMWFLDTYLRLIFEVAGDSVGAIPTLRVSQNHQKPHCSCLNRYRVVSQHDPPTLRSAGVSSVFSVASQNQNHQEPHSMCPNT